MSGSINLALTDELKAFVDQNCGDGTLYTSPEEFIRGVLREKKERMDAARLREAILEGYQDVLEGRVHPWQGGVGEMLKRVGG